MLGVLRAAQEYDPKRYPNAQQFLRIRASYAAKESAKRIGKRRNREASRFAEVIGEVTDANDVYGWGRRGFVPLTDGTEVSRAPVEERNP